MDDERELMAGPLAKDASFRLIVKGAIGVKEIERLIKKLELDKEIILADESTIDQKGVAGGGLKLYQGLLSSLIAWDVVKVEFASLLGEEAGLLDAETHHECLFDIDCIFPED